MNAHGESSVVIVERIGFKIKEVTAASLYYCPTSVAQWLLRLQVNAPSLGVSRVRISAHSDFSGVGMVVTCKERREWCVRVCKYMNKQSAE